VIFPLKYFTDMRFKDTVAGIFKWIVSCASNPFIIFSFFLTVMSYSTGYAQVSGLTVRSPPMTHAMLDSSEFLVGVGLSYSKTTNPTYRISNVEAETAIATEIFGFLAYAFTDYLALGVSTNPTEVKIKGVESSTSVNIDTKINSSRSYYYIIPTLARWNKNRIALIWGKGTANQKANTSLNIEESSYKVGTTGLISEIYLGQNFSIMPWASWPYLLFDVSPFGIADIQTPDFGFDGVLHFGNLRISLTLIFQALETIDESSDEDQTEATESTSEKDSSQEAFAVSFSYTF